VFGPVVVIVSVTGVVTAPAASEAGLNTQFVNAGWLLHAKLTAELKVALPTGAAENLYAALWPASTVAEASPVSFQVSARPTVSVSGGVKFVRMASVP
jgi:hypothetical protein